ncbi:hypothetical protein A5634_15445 [Mycobacterium asiaticum]|uniref:PE domain-containing protein n=1 Tax=Mycobacterium asiaticum TaxID=1790 RepID=A0A1A3P943_MYCAS|nr:PE family protein [Mycobacterium asiaticum]OBK30681.1 hypothetical protein A5634_15445 [Mycobacterium asiaticum]
MQVAPESLLTATRDLGSIGSDLRVAHLEAAAPTTNIASAASDEISTAVAGVFGAHAQDFQKVAEQAAAFHDQFTQQLNGSANAYASAEAASAAALGPVLPAEDNGWTTLIQLGALALTPPLFVALLGFASTLLAAYWAVTLFSTVVLGNA